MNNGPIDYVKKSHIEKRNEMELDRIFQELEELFWQEPDIYIALCDYCQNWPRSTELDDSVRKNLESRGLLSKDKNKLPDVTNEAVYEATKGKKPFWL